MAFKRLKKAFDDFMKDKTLSISSWYLRLLFEINGNLDSIAVAQRRIADNGEGSTQAFLAASQAQQAFAASQMHFFVRDLNIENSCALCTLGFDDIRHIKPLPDILLPIDVPESSFKFKSADGHKFSPFVDNPLVCILCGSHRGNHDGENLN